MTSLYEMVGGDQWFFDLVDRFYDGVETDEVLRPLYPDDLSPSRHHLAEFLIQYWGGPTTYSDQRGHPRLRMRHVNFSIGEAERDAWLHHMFAAVKVAALASDVEEEVLAYFDNAADHLINRAED